MTTAALLFERKTVVKGFYYFAQIATFRDLFASSIDP
jgi:hypothetical protein